MSEIGLDVAGVKKSEVLKAWRVALIVLFLSIVVIYYFKHDTLHLVEVELLLVSSIVIGYYIGIIEANLKLEDEKEVVPNG